MKKIIIFMSLILMSCGETAKVQGVFNEMKEAACSSNFDGYAQHIDYNLLADTVGLEPLKNDKEREMIIKRIKTMQRYTIKSDKKNAFCDIEIKGITIEDDFAYIKVMSNKYYTNNYQFDKIDNKWKFCSYGRIEGPQRQEATDFRAELDKNWIAASEKYKNKSIRLYGKILEIDNDKDGKTYIALNAGMFRPIVCYIDQEYLPDITRVKAKQNIHITGIFGGRKSFDAAGIIKFNYPFLKDCVFWND